MARKKMDPITRIKTRHERRINNLKKKRAAIKAQADEDIARVDASIQESQLILKQLAK